MLQEGAQKLVLTRRAIRRISPGGLANSGELEGVMAANWQVVEKLVNDAGQVLRWQVVDVALTEVAARELAMELASGEYEAPEEGRRFIYMAEEGA